MTPLDRVMAETEYLNLQRNHFLLEINLHVFSSGAQFRIVDPSTGGVLHVTKPAEFRTTQEFRAALDRAVTKAKKMNS